MFARKVAVRLKPDSLKEFVSLMEGEIIPWLRQQPGFLDLIVLASPDACEVATISFWDQEGNAQAYNSSGYPEALKMLEKLLDGKPYVKTFHVISSTLQKVTSGSAIEAADQQAARQAAKRSAEETGPIHQAYHSYETSI